MALSCRYLKYFADYFYSEIGIFRYYIFSASDYERSDVTGAIDTAAFVYKPWGWGLSCHLFPIYHSDCVEIRGDTTLGQDAV